MTTTIILSSGEWVNVPEGADPDYVRKINERRILNAAAGKPKKYTVRRSSRSGKPSKKINYAERVLCGSPFDAGMMATARRMDELKAEVG